ncbi:MAG: siderophore ABC transporter substrate-binding protein [Pseudomonadota bacterium]
MVMRILTATMPARRPKIWAAAFCFSLAAAFTASAVEIETWRGPVEVAGPPERIAVFDIAAIDTIDALGVPITGAPNYLYLDWLEQSLTVEAEVGDIFEPDLEALNALNLDLIVVGGRSYDQLDSVARVAPSIDMTIWGLDLIDQARSRIAAYGALFEKEAAAAELLSALDAKVNEARDAALGKGDALIVMTNGPKISVFGADSRFGWMHDVLGVPAAVADDDPGVHGAAASFELIAKVDPDWLLVVDRAAAIGSSEQNARATLDNAVMQGVDAWTSGRVIYLPSGDLYIAAGGARATINVLDAVIDGYSGR